MKTKIFKAGQQHADACMQILKNSELGKRYYPNDDSMLSKIKEGIAEDEFYAVSCDDRILGFIWFRLNGAFSSFPYLHMIVVDEKCRNCGIGQKLITYYEQRSLELTKSLRTKSFLVVADFNEKAHSLYRRLGYEDLLPIKGLYRKGITENFMVKNIIRDRSYQGWCTE